MGLMWGEPQRIVFSFSESVFHDHQIPLAYTDKVMLVLEAKNQYFSLSFVPVFL